MDKFSKTRGWIKENYEDGLFICCLLYTSPALLPLPILMALYYAFYNMDISGSFLWIKDLGAPDQYFILPILAALSTYLPSYLMTKATPNNCLLYTSSMIQKILFHLHNGILLFYPLFYLLMLYLFLYLKMLILLIFEKVH